MPVFSPHDLVGRTFLMDPDRDGNVHRAKILEAIEGFDNNLEKNPTRIKFKCTTNNEEFTDLIAYNEVADYISRDNSQHTLWQFEEIVSHQGPLSTEHKDYNGSTYNVQIRWSTSVYGDCKEVFPTDTPVPLGRPVLTTTYVDANLMHDLLSGKSVTGILHLLNKTPIDWYSKKQATVETATVGSEYVAARTAVEQIIDLRTTLQAYPSATTATCLATTTPL